MNNVSKNIAILIRSQVEPKRNYRDYIDILRYDFCYSCAYCSISESEALGIGFEIDHYYPKRTHPSLIQNYANLMWSCQHCNRHKSDFSPNEAQESRGHVILRPDKDDPRKHYEVVHYNLKGKTQTGNFNIVKLNLNRKTLKNIREIRKRFSNAVEYIAFGIPYLRFIKLDLIHDLKQRILFSRIRDELNKKLEDINRVFEKIIINRARSPLLDMDPEEKEHTKKRKEYLKEQKMIDSDSFQRVLEKRGVKR